LILLLLRDNLKELKLLFNHKSSMIKITAHQVMLRYLRKKKRSSEEPNQEAALSKEVFHPERLLRVSLTKSLIRLLLKFLNL
jgi:hypothetical protein